MKKITINLSVLALTLALGAAAPAAAQDFSTFYVTPKIVSSYQRGEMSGTVLPGGAGMSGGHERGAVLGLGVSVGVDLSYSSALPVRLEAEYLYHGNQTFRHQDHNWINTYEVSSHSLLFNAFYDIATDTAFTPYVGGGLGLANVNVDFNSANTGLVPTKSNKWNFAWDIGGGVAWSLNENLALDLGYRYMDLGRGENGNLAAGASAIDLTAHEFGLGLRITGF